MLFLLKATRIFGENNMYGSNVFISIICKECIPGCDLFLYEEGISYINWQVESPEIKDMRLKKENKYSYNIC